MTNQAINSVGGEPTLVHNANEGGVDEKSLTFRLGDEQYGVGILQVREIISITDITALPRTPEYVKGVINLRGKIIPVIDLRARFGFPSIPYAAETCIIVVEIDGTDESDAFEVGVIVDTVSEVISIPSSDIESAPRFGGSVNAAFLRGVGRIGDEVVILLDLNRVLSNEECNEISQSSFGNGNAGSPDSQAA